MLQSLAHFRDFFYMNIFGVCSISQSVDAARWGATRAKIFLSTCEFIKTHFWHYYTPQLSTLYRYSNKHKCPSGLTLELVIVHHLQLRRRAWPATEDY